MASNIYCSICGEPWDINSFHDYAEARDITFKELLHDFYARGCVATGDFEPGYKCKPASEAQAFRAQASGALADLLGDDVDGLAAELEDAEYFGLFND